MRLTLLNGSPRGKRSNSQVILRWFQEGFESDFEVFNINQPRFFEKAIDDIVLSDTILLVVPLYVDSMPAQVLRFFEVLNEQREQLAGKRIGFFIHSGFSEGYQSYSLRDTLERIAFKLGLDLLPSVIMGGSEGVRLMPDNYQKKNRNAVIGLGRELKEQGTFTNTFTDILIKPIRLSKTRQTVMKTMIKTGTMQLYWNNWLKRNNAYEKRFARPYENK